MENFKRLVKNVMTGKTLKGYSFQARQVPVNDRRFVVRAKENTPEFWLSQTAYVQGMTLTSFDSLERRTKPCVSTTDKIEWLNDIELPILQKGLSKSRVDKLFSELSDNPEDMISLEVITKICPVEEFDKTKAFWISGIIKKFETGQLSEASTLEDFKNCDCDPRLVESVYDVMCHLNN